MMKRLAAAGVVTAALGGVLLSAAPALANDDETEINQEKVLELNLICNVPILAVVKDRQECGGTEAVVKDDDEANDIKIKNEQQHHHHGKQHGKKR
ncbi:hypothetical protein [Actinomadura rugatobispora]|uniref:Secreted protein n=1 Tax=Actinomadura rugatobispora TaxID=1994 RepID=A0ABW1A597_9ACTN|nr:hypothetical protein GCM10010200_067120 [Actinomadura rugatobispora]